MEIKPKINEVYYIPECYFNLASVKGFTIFKCVKIYLSGGHKADMIGVFLEEECAKVFCDAWNERLNEKNKSEVKNETRAQKNL